MYQDNTTFIGRLVSSGGLSGPSGEDGGPGTAFVYHAGHQHRSLIIDNDGRTSQYAGEINSYHDISQDSFKAWILPNSVDHALATRHGKFDPNPAENRKPGFSTEMSFEEMQVFKNAHLAVMLSHEANETMDTVPNDVYMHFRHMIGRF